MGDCGKLIVGDVKETEELVGRKEREKARCRRPLKINRWKKNAVFVLGDVERD